LEVEEDGSRKSPRRDDAFSPFDGSGSFFLLLDFEVFDLESKVLVKWIDAIKTLITAVA